MNRSCRGFLLFDFSAPGPSGIVFVDMCALIGPLIQAVASEWKQALRVFQEEPNKHCCEYYI